jgi:hypothetical protein
MDNTQRPTEKISAWRNVTIPGRATGAYSERSISGQKVEAFFVEIRNAN